MVLLLVLLPFAAYIVGEKIGVSGILAAVAAGIATNFADLDRSSFISERLQTEGTWSMVERPSTAPSSCCWACSCRPSSACRCTPAMTGGFWLAMWP
jgi:hypothetical protein